MIKYQWESWRGIVSEALPLLDYYFNNGGVLFAKELPMDPDIEGAAWLDATGRMQILTARRDGKLVGLNGFNVGGMLFRSRVVAANGLVLYLLPSERRGMTGVRLIKEAEKGLREMGVQLIIYTNGSDFDLGPLLLKLGYVTSNGALYEKLFPENIHGDGT